MPPWYRQRRGIGLALLYGLATLAGIALTARGAFLGSVPADGSTLPFVYLYGFLGAMAYAFTSVVKGPDREFRGLVRVVASAGRPTGREAEGATAREATVGER